MGYSEFGGGGSVHWRVTHGGNGGNGRGHGRGGNGHDPRPNRAEGGNFFVVVGRDQVFGPFPIDFDDDRQIEVIWSPDTVADLPRLRAAADADRRNDNPGRDGGGGRDK